METVHSAVPAKPDVRAGDPSIIPIEELLIFPHANVAALNDKLRSIMKKSLGYHMGELSFHFNRMSKSTSDTASCDHHLKNLLALSELCTLLNAPACATAISAPPSPQITDNSLNSCSQISTGSCSQNPKNLNPKGTQTKRCGSNSPGLVDKSAKCDNEGFTEVPRRLRFKPKEQANTFDSTPLITPDQLGTDINPDVISAAMDTSDSLNVHKKEPKPPPIKIIPDDKWHVHVAAVKHFAPTISSKLSGRFLSLSVNTPDEYRALRNYLDDRKIQNWTYLLDEDKPFKVVIRGLPVQTASDQIKRYLELEGYDQVKVTQMYRGPRNNRVVMPLFFVQVLRTSDIAKIYCIKELLGTEVQVERYRGAKGPSQCHNCQYFWHSSIACKLHPRCVKCGGPHRTESCTKVAEDPCVCCNCGGPHPANFRKCPKFPKLKTKRAAKKIVNNQERKVDQVPSGRIFFSKNITNSRSYANAATGEDPFPELPKKQIPNTSAPNREDCSVADLLKQIMVLEANYDKQIIAKAFKEALPAIRKATHSADQAYFLYESLIRLSP